MGFIETSYGSNPNLSQVNIDSILNMGNYGITASGDLNILNTMNLNNNDLVGVKRFMCADFMGSLLAVASDNLQETVILDDVSYNRTKYFRVPSNFVAGSSIKLGICVVTIASGTSLSIQKYDPLTETYTNLDAFYVSDTGGNQVWLKSTAFAVNAGDLISLYSNSYNLSIIGSEGVKIYYDPNAVSGAVWEVITP